MAGRLLQVFGLALLAGPVAAASPDVTSVQAAYVDARQGNAERHAYDLVIETAKCQPLKAGGYMCQIDFTREGERDRRLYFDVVTLDEKAGRWQLLSGLCITKPPPNLR